MTAPKGELMVSVAGGSTVFQLPNGLCLGHGYGTEPGSKYMLLMDHWFDNGDGGSYVPQGTLGTVGVEIPFDWVPTQAVDPRDWFAALAYWNNGPIGMADPERWRDQQPWGPQNGRFVGGFVPPPQVYWTPSGGISFTLTDFAAHFGPKNDPLA